MRNPHRPFMLKSSEILQQEHKQLCLCKELYGSGSKGMATGSIYIGGTHGRIFDPFESDSDRVIEWMITKHKPEFLAVVERFSNNFENLSFRRVAVLRALEIAWYLEKCQSYKDIQVTWPEKTPTAYYTFVVHLQRAALQFMRDKGLDYLIPTATMRQRYTYFKLALDAVLVEAPKSAATSGHSMLFGVISKREVFEEGTGIPRPEYNLCTYSFYNSNTKTLSDLGAERFKDIDMLLKAADVMVEILNP